MKRNKYTIGHKFAKGGSGDVDISAAISGGLGLATSGIETYKRLSELPSQEEKIQALKDVQNATGNIGQLDSMQSLEDFANATNFAKTNYNANLTGRMGNGEMAGEIIKESLMQGGQGAMSGFSAGGPWGALIGGVVGTAQGLGTSIAGVAVRNQKAQTMANKLNAEGEMANKRLISSINDKAGNIALNNANMARLNMAAFGGPLHSGTFDNGVRFITKGGSHEENPYGGVLQGVASDGLPNLVEEGEVIYNDYVYSKRLNVPSKDKEFLGLKKNKEYTYADAAELLQRESEERPNDSLSKRNLEAMMLRLQDSQEQLKQQREVKKFKRDFNKLTPAEQLNFVMSLQQEGQQPQVMPQEEVSKKFDDGGEIDDGEMLSKPALLKINPINHNFLTPDAKKRISNLYNTPTTDSNDEFSYSSGAQALRAIPVLGSAIGALTSSFDKPDYSTMQRTENKYEAIPHVSATPVGERLTFNPIDVNYFATQMNNQGIGARRAAMESGAGYNIPYNMYQGQTALGDMFMKALEFDNRQRQSIGEFNRQTDMFNSQQALAAANAEMQRGANIAQGYFQTGRLRDEELGKVQAAKSLQLTNMFNNMGNLGQDMLARDLNTWLANKGVYGVGAEGLSNVVRINKSAIKPTTGKKGGNNA